MAAAVAPIEAGFAQGAAELFERFKINGELFKEALSALGEAEALILRCEEIFREQAVHHLHAEIAREMVVADSRMAERRVLRAGPGAEMSLLRGEAHHRLQQAADIVIGKREIAVPPLLALNEQTAGLHFRKMRAGRLRGNARFARELPSLGLECAPGDAIVFDFRVLHRGMANTSGKWRPVLYQTVSRAWWTDDFNFPEESIDDAEANAADYQEGGPGTRAGFIRRDL